MKGIMAFDSVIRLPMVLFVALAVVLLAVPGVIHWLFAMEGGPSANVLARRAGCLFLGLATICALAPRWTRVERVVSAGIVVAMAALAVLGLIEYLRGAVGVGIWLAISVEVVLAALFLPHVTR